AFGLLLPAPAPAQIAYRDHTSAGAASTAGASITHISPGGFVATAAGFSCAQTIAPTTPGGVVGDLLIALAVSKDTAATTLQASAGWNTLFADDNPGGFSYQARIYWRFADGTASDNLTVSRVNPAAAGCDVLLGRMSRFRGVDPVDPFQTGSPVPAANWTFSNSAAVTTGTETTTAPNSMLIFAALIGDNDGTGRPAGFTAESFDSGTGNGTDGQVSLKYGLQATAGLEGPFSVAKGGVDPNHGVLIALRPAEGLRINLPALTAAGDVMVASIAVRPSTIVVSAPPGWTQVRDMPQVAGTTSRMATYYRTAATPIANEPASHNFTFSGGAATGAAGGIISFSGVDTTTPIDAEDGNTTPSALTHTVTPGITTTVADTMLVGSFEFTSTPDAANWTSNLTTDRVNQGSIASPSDLGMRLLMAHEARAAIGATGTRTATASGVGADTGLAFLLALRPGVNINHFSISHAGSGVACVDQTITITAHDAAHSPVSANSLAVALSTTNSRGTWTGIVAGGGVLSDPTPGDGAATYTFAAASSSVQLSFRYANLAATSETFGFNVSSGGFSETTGTATAADDPSFTMAQAGFQFRNVTDGNTTIPTQISGRPSDTPVVGKTISIQAIRTDTATGACVALFGSQTRTVDLGAECNNPATCAAQLVSVNGTNIATSNDNGGAGAAAYTGVSLTFNASSEAATVIAYPDAGQMSLHARFDLDPGVAGFEMTGASNPFVVRPFGFAFRGATAGTLIQHS
ncbi:MAG: hypothetical protein HYV99_08835, partial [Betaproteobacteria bacterium]|nr:hypothetical protein [Betaproteobacteria bacterium]